MVTSHQQGLDRCVCIVHDVQNTLHWVVQKLLICLSLCTSPLYKSTIVPGPCHPRPGPGPAWDPARRPLAQGSAPRARSKYCGFPHAPKMIDFYVLRYKYRPCRKSTCFGQPKSRLHNIVLHRPSKYSYIYIYIYILLQGLAKHIAQFTESKDFSLRVGCFGTDAIQKCTK